MKRVGAIVRCDHTGLGIQSKEFYDHIPCKAMVVDVSRVNSTMKQNHDWYPGCPVVYYTKNNRFPIPVIKDFLRGLEVLITFETPYDDTLFALCKLMGVKTILQLNYEFLDFPSDKVPPDLFAAPSLWHYDEIPAPKIFFQVPVNTTRFTPKVKPNTFVHIVGKAAVHDRNGTGIFIDALKYVKNDIVVELKSQFPITHKLQGIPNNVKVSVQVKNNENYWDNYTGGVLVMPRKYGGQSLPTHEGLAAEMPVIMPNISPNFSWLPAEWLVPAEKKSSFQCKKKVDIYETDPQALARKIDEFCNPEFYRDALIKSRYLKQKISWETQLPEYYKVLFG